MIMNILIFTGYAPPPEKAKDLDYKSIRYAQYTMTDTVIARGGCQALLVHNFMLVLVTLT